MAQIRASGLRKSFGTAGARLEVLRGIDWKLESGQKIGIIGASGSGKSTLLHVLAGLEPPTEGTVFFDGEDVYRLPEHRRATLRNRQIGFVFQFYHLLPELTALENVLLPALMAGVSQNEARLRAGQLLGWMDLSPRSAHRPRELSGGEQQRVAIARAQMMKPAVLFADEPTGNLDSATGEKVLDYLLKVQQEEKNALVLVTHNVGLLTQMDLHYELKDGKLHAALSS